jgi:hypothetical protein
MRHAGAPPPRDEVREQCPGRRRGGAREDDARKAERISLRTVAVEGDDEIARRRKRYAGFLDGDDQVQRDELVRRDDAEKPTDRVGEELAQPSAR